LRPSFDWRIRWERIRSGVALVVVIECHVHLRLVRESRQGELSTFRSNTVAIHWPASEERQANPGRERGTRKHYWLRAAPKSLTC
jgi:hypothetical protein